MMSQFPPDFLDVSSATSRILVKSGSLQHHTGGHPHTYSIPDAPWKIEDEPRFQYRGLMIDTSRHFLPTNGIRRQIDGLSFNKMNALHWHLTDAQSTPYDSVVHPKLKEGAFSEHAVYTAEDIKQLVEYCELQYECQLSFEFSIENAEMMENCP